METILPNRPAPPPRILLRSSWQTVNIGDIGHTPGALRLFEGHFPAAEIYLWPNLVDRGVREQLLAAWPALHIVEGDVDLQGKATTDELQRAFDQCDVMVHGSGPNVMAWEHFEAWRNTGRPYGLLGITFDRTRFRLGLEEDWEGGTLEELRAKMLSLPRESISPKERELFAAPSFVFLRDSLSLEFIRQQFPAIPHAAFGPDMSFACDLQDDPTAEAWRRSHGLEEKKFICVIPRLRWTPYHLIHQRAPDESEKVKDAINARTRSADHAGLREMIIHWVRHTGLKVVVCPEMTYEMQLGREELIDPLPADVKAQVVWRDTYWLNDEASAVYRKAHTVISLENHSPILALGTPTIFIRQPTDTCKGQMWRDLGLTGFFEVGEATGDQLWGQLRAIYDDYPGAQAAVAALCERVAARQREMILAVQRTALGEAPLQV